MFLMDQYLRIVDLIYEAALQPELWPNVMKSIQNAVSGCGTLLGIDVGGQPRFLEFTGYDSRAMASFANQYADKSYVWSLLPRAGEGVLIHDRHVLTDQQRRHDVFANEWAVEYDTADCIVIPLIKRPNLTAFAVLARSPGCGEFDDQALDFSKRLIPHLRRAMLIKTRLDDAEIRAELSINVIETLEDGVIFVTAESEVTYLNRAALRMLTANSDVLSLQAAFLRGNRSDVKMPLDRLIAGASGRIGDGERVGGMFAIERKNQLRPLTIACVPLPDLRRGSLARQPSAMLLLSDTAHTIQISASVLGNLFQLTPAEARLALHLAGGSTLAQAAREFGVTRTTVTSQLSAIFKKTHTNRQGELISLLHNLPKMSIDSAPMRPY
jgi:DNA-binding CsgD family transcriptional regulator/PAS domain-containing protein